MSYHHYTHKSSERERHIFICGDYPLTKKRKIPRQISLRTAKILFFLMIVFVIWNFYELVHCKFEEVIWLKRDTNSKLRKNLFIRQLESVEHPTTANLTNQTAPTNALSKSDYPETSLPTADLPTTSNPTLGLPTIGNTKSETSFSIRHEAVIQKKPDTNVLFLKTHKTGSSTVTNILQRYAKSNNLNVALPNCDHRFCYPNKFDENYIYQHKPGDKYNMLFNHAVFDKEKMLNIMAPNTKMITIIREPYSQFDSAAQYLNFKKYFNLKSHLPLLDEFFQISEDFLKKFIQSADQTEGEGAFSLAKNPNAFDLGFDVWNESHEYIGSVLKAISKDFDLVMITEYMEESLVLLKNELNWNLEDIVFFSLNAREIKDKNTNDIKSVTTKILNWNKIDTAIYKHFNMTFWKKIENSPSEFFSDVNTLKQWNIDLVNHCSRFETTKASLLITRNYYEKARGSLCNDIKSEDTSFTFWFKWAFRYKKRGIFPLSFY
ncbi:galactose-3-O-sulfotransferase 2 isoform X3 [Hydra vulgaris]|nr:galactose-3-O-sulfotransferase 2 isoform X3 [Hydra vulgaris]XP_047143896.1 galactose-3-O-sulfotransferase 2 isoform X3 [Hydra vulgaris]